MSKNNKRVKKENSFTNRSKGDGAFNEDVGVEYENLKTKSLDNETINNIYYGNLFFRRIIDEIPSDSLKNGFDIVFSPENESTSKKILDIYEYLQLDNYLIEFIQKGRKDGFSALLPIFKGVNLITSEPLELKRIKEILDFNIIEKKDISKIERYKDINKPYYGEIEYIYIKNQNGTSTKYHTSSLLIFETGIIGNRKEIKNETHLSFYTGLFDALQVNYNVIWSTGQSAFASFLKVLKIGDANELDKIKKNGFSKYQKKKEMQLDSSSLAVIGAKDTLEVIGLSGKTDFESLQKVSINDIATRLGIPVSKLMGASAGALASAEQDSERYKEVVEQYQRVIVKDFLKKVLDMLMATLEIYESKYEIIFKSIAAKDIKKEAEVGKIQAERDKIKAEATKTSIETLITLNKELNDDSIANTLKKLADKLKDSLILDLELEDE